MSYRRVSMENPPTDPKAFAEWIMRQFMEVNGALDQIVDFTPTGIMPTKVTNGMARYFVAPIPSTAIISAGPWMYVEGVWLKMT